MSHQVILWVDDDADDLEIFSRAVREVNADTEIVEARDGLEALDFLRTAKEAGRLPCLVILDMNMPRLGGRETLARIKTNEDYRSVETIVFTTSESPLDRAFCKKYGTDMFTKPHSYELLRELAKRFLGICQRRGAP